MAVGVGRSWKGSERREGGKERRREGEKEGKREGRREEGSGWRDVTELLEWTQKHDSRDSMRAGNTRQPVRGQERKPEETGTNEGTGNR
ncbi:hypothetical protein EYF80_053316 [Liparis tanakae]|uniref:Uncharacterized protein n=1 Tax=Liparis tanakae TaxID=230148 RepID=A0A4Z2F6V1_9TELE|nr:hypothetical protein EYF80_053316 [Liparis tanakae]